MYQKSTKIVLFSSDITWAAVDISCFLKSLMPTSTSPYFCCHEDNCSLMESMVLRADPSSSLYPAVWAAASDLKKKESKIDKMRCTNEILTCLLLAVYDRMVCVYVCVCVSVCVWVSKSHKCYLGIDIYCDTWPSQLF